MTALRRCLLPLSIAALLVVLAAPATAAAASPRYPTQSLGNRGADVKAIQWLLNERGYPVAVDGVFGADHGRCGQGPSDGDRAAGQRHRRRRHVDEAGRAGEPRQHGPGRVRRAAPTARQAPPGPAGRRRLRGVDADGRPGVPEARGPGGHRDRQRHDLAPPDLALRAADVQQDVALRLQRRQRHGELGDERGDQPARGGRPGRREAGARPGRGRGHRRCSTAATSPATRPTSAASTSTCG